MGWTGRSYTTTTTTPGSTSPSSAAVQELEQLLAKNDSEGFQQAWLAVAKNPTKDVYHFLLRTLAQEPKKLASLQSDPSAGTFNPLNSAVSLLTDMNHQANVLGRSALQPDRETILLLLKVAESKEMPALSQGEEYAQWESTRILVDAIRHGRMPAVMSIDQWELPDLNIELDQELWKAMFTCIHTSAPTTAGPRLKKWLDTTTYLMADQLCRSEDVQMDEQLWIYVVEALGNDGSVEKLKSIRSKLPPVNQSSPELYSVVAEALANCGSRKQALHTINALVNTHSTLPTIRPFEALARQNAKIGDFEAIRDGQKMWAAKGQHSDASSAGIVDIHRSMLSAIALSLERIAYVNSKTFRDRQADTLPEDVLPGMSTSPQLNRTQFTEAEYMWRHVQESMKAIPEAELTAEDYDVRMRVMTRLNLLQPFVWPLANYASKLIPEMKARGLKPLKSTYHTLMETMARTREHGTSRENGQVFQQITKVLGKSLQDGYKMTSPNDFLPLIEACFGTYTPSPFTARQWMYSNQLYPASTSTLKKVEKMMEIALTPKDQDGKDSGSSAVHGAGIQQYHNSTTLASVLAGLAHGDEMDEVLKRWNDLVLQGVERDASLYQAIIGASHRQEKLALYVMRNIRHEMLKETPPVPMTSEIFAGLMNCCIRIQDSVSARNLIAQYSFSGTIQKTSEWYMPMVSACLMIDGMEDEGLFLLEEMKNMRMDVKSGAFYEFLMEYFVMKRMDYQAGQEIFKEFIKNEQDQIKEIMDDKEKAIGTMHGQPVLMISEKELEKRAKRLLAPVDHMVERVTISARTASMLNLLVLAHIRERPALLERERTSGFGAGSRERLKDAQTVMHYLTGETRQRASSPSNSDSSSPSTQPSTAESSTSSSSSLLFPSQLRSPSEFGVPSDEQYRNSGKQQLVFVNKYVLGEYIDTCIKEGSPEMLAEADWALNKVMPRVIKADRMVKDTQRLRQALGNAQNRHQPLQPQDQVEEWQGQGDASDYVQSR